MQKFLTTNACLLSDESTKRTHFIKIPNSPQLHRGSDLYEYPSSRNSYSPQCIDNSESKSTHRLRTYNKDNLLIPTHL